MLSTGAVASHRKGVEGAIIYGSLKALVQDDLKRRLTYSTVSQVSLIILGVSVVGRLSTIGGIAHLVHQGLMKITLFFCAGNLSELGVQQVKGMRGVGRRMPLTMSAFTLASLGLIGVPPLAVFVTKTILAYSSVSQRGFMISRAHRCPAAHSRRPRSRT